MPYFEEFVFFVARKSLSVLSLLGEPIVLYLLVYVDDGVEAGKSRFAARYVPPEYDGRYVVVDVRLPKRGVVLESAVATSSRDEY